MANEKELHDKIAELEATVVHQRKRADTAEDFICTMCAECKWEVHDGILIMQKACCAWFPECNKFKLRPGWIPVAERLPNDDRTPVLIALRWDSVDIGWYSEDGGCWGSEFVNEYDDGEVTHWMPLPEPPKE